MQTEGNFPPFHVSVWRFISQVWHVHLPNIVDRGSSPLEPDLHIFICKTTSPFLNPTLQINPF